MAIDRWPPEPPEVPWSCEAEQSVLGGLLLDNDAWGRVSEVLTDGAFYRFAHGQVYSAIGALVATDRPADVITVFEQLQHHGRGDECGGMPYLNSLAQSVPSAANIRHYAEIVREKSTLRALLAGLDRAGAAAREAPDAAQALGRALQIIGDLAASAAAAPAELFRLLRVADLDNMPPMRWRIHGVLPAEGCAAIFGPSGSGKSFLELDMLAALCEGNRWFGYRVPHACPALVIVLEGEAGFRKRVKAWESDNGRPFPDGARFLFGSFNLLERDHVVALAAAIDACGGVGVVFIDTLNRAAPGADENSAQDMSRILEAVKLLHSMVGGVVVLVHHTGKEATKGLRGHSSLAAALDATIEVTRLDDAREWRLAKVKDEEDGMAHPFALRRVDLGDDEDGEPVTSCVVERRQALDEPAPRLRLPKGGNQKIVFDALGPLFRESRAFGQAGAPASRPCITLIDAIAGTRDKLLVESGRRTERARQALTGLVSTGVLGSNDDWLWLR